MRLRLQKEETMAFGLSFHMGHHGHLILAVIIASIALSFCPQKKFTSVEMNINFAMTDILNQIKYF